MSGEDSRAPAPRGMEATDTRWSRIEEGDLTYVVQRFWRPIRRFLQTRLGSLEEAEDATQALFVKFIEKDLLATADRARGRFRSYLFTVVRRFMIDRLRAQNAIARGAGEGHLPLEGASAELTAEGLTPDEAFDRDWFFSLLNQARREVRSQLAGDGRETVYHAFHLYYFGDDSVDRWTQPRIAERLAISTAQVNNHVNRCRELLRRQVRAAVSEYVGDERELERELEELRRHLGDGPAAPVSEIFASAS